MAVLIEMDRPEHCRTCKLAQPYREQKICPFTHRIVSWFQDGRMEGCPLKDVPDELEGTEDGRTL